MEKPTDTFLTQVTTACRHALYVAGFFSLFINMFMLTVSLYMLQVYDRVLAGHSYETLFYLTAISIIALVIMALLDMARSRILVRTGHWLDTTLSPAALSKCADEILQGRPYGTQALRDVATIRQFAGGAGVIAFFDSPWVPIYLVIIFILHPVLGLIGTVGAIALFLLALWNEIATREPLAEANAKNIVTQQYVDASLRNAEIIQAMGMMDNIVKHWDEKNADVMQLQDIASNRAGVILSISKFLRLLLQILMLGVGAMLVINNQMTAGAMIAASILLSRALAPVEQSIGVWKQWLSARQAYERLKKHFTEKLRVTTSITLPKPQGELHLEEVTYFAPRIEKPIIQGVSLQLNQGEMIAIIGPSGAGKSTLARLIVGALKTSSGNIRLDGADVYTWDRSDFGGYIGYLPQDVELFPGTVKDNIARMGDVEDEAVIAAAKLAGVHDFILHLPQGYDTPIGNGSLFSLSGGQRQRVALARTLYKEPRLIILDEPNSNLDNEGEEALQKALLAMKSIGSTQIIISHRPTIVRHVDRIVVLNKGRIQYSGPRDAVLEELQKIAKSQAQLKG